MRLAEKVAGVLQLGLLVLILVLTQLARAQTVPTWAQISVMSSPPSVRSLHSANYDPATNRMIVFAGDHNDVWVLTNANGLGGTPTWTQLSPTGDPPSGRGGHSAVYDPAANRMIVFGGFTRALSNDVWVLTNASGLGGAPTWTQLSPTSSPPAGRSAHRAVYDPASNRMIVFGGGGGHNDVWVLTNANGLGRTPAWTQLSPTGGPPSGRAGHSAVYDPGTNRMTVFGGFTGGFGAFGQDRANDVWVLANANGLGGRPVWTQLSPTGSLPDKRDWHSAVYDPGTNRMIVFGGKATRMTGFGRFVESNVNDAWVLTNANGLGGMPTWTQLRATDRQPTGRWGHSAVYHQATNRMTIFGGNIGSLADNTLLNEVWVLTNANGL